MPFDDNTTAPVDAVLSEQRRSLVTYSQDSLGSTLQREIELTLAQRALVGTIGTGWRLRSRTQRQRDKAQLRHH